MTNSKPDPKILEYVAKDDPGCGREFSPNLCVMRHTAAKKKESKGLEYGLCAYCPLILKFLGREGQRRPPSLRQTMYDEEPVKICKICEAKPARKGFSVCSGCLAIRDKPHICRTPAHKPAPETIEKENPEMNVRPVKRDEQKACAHCKTPVVKYHARGLCHKCYFDDDIKALYPAKGRWGNHTQKPPRPTKTCIAEGCKNPAGKYSKLGYCKSCACKVNAAKGRANANASTPDTIPAAPEPVKIDSSSIIPNRVSNIDVPGVGTCPEPATFTEPASNNIHARSAPSGGIIPQAEKKSWLHVSSGVSRFCQAKLIELNELKRQFKNQQELLNIKSIEIGCLEKFLDELKEAARI